MSRLTGVLLLSLMLSLPASAQAGKVPAWLLFLPKADRTAAAGHVAVMEQALGAMIQDRTAAVAAEAAYARNARVLAAALDAYGDTPDQFRIGAFLMGKNDLSVPAARDELVFNRRLRWETARDLAGNRYGHVEKAGLVTAATQEERLGRAGRSLAELFAARIAKTAKKNLVPAVTALEDLIAGHPDCPKAAFAELRLRAAALDAAAYRAWCVALAGGSPRSLAADLPVYPEAPDEAETAYRLARERFAAAYALRGALHSALPAAAAAGWYVDVYGGAEPVPAEARPAIETWLRNAALLDPPLLAEQLREDPVLAETLAELGSILWVAWIRQDTRFTLEYGLEADLLRPALDVIWAAVHAPTPAPAPPPPTAPEAGALPPVMDLPAVLRADQFADALRGTDDPAALVDAYFALQDDAAGKDAFLRGLRYQKVREKLNLALDALLVEILTTFSAQDGAAGEFRRESGFPGGALVASVALRRTLEDGRTVLTVPPPETVRPAFENARRLLDSGTVVLVPPGVVASRLLEPDEQLLVGEQSLYLGSAAVADAWTNRRLEVLSARYGIPAALAVGPGTETGAALRRYAVLSASGFRYAHLLRQKR